MTRNYLAFDKLIIHSGFGYNVWKAYNPLAKVEGYYSESYELQNELSKVKKNIYYRINEDKIYLSQAKQYIKENPLKYFMLYLKRLFAFYFFDLDSSQKNYYNFFHIYPITLLSLLSFPGLFLFYKVILVLLNALATIRGRKRVEVFKHTIPMQMLNLALSVFLFTLGGVLLGIFFLSITDGHLGLTRLAFEQVSAFCTVGLSMGITSDLSEVGKIILMISMLIGRIGTVTLAFALTRRKKESHDYTYPKAQVQVG